MSYVIKFSVFVGGPALQLFCWPNVEVPGAFIIEIVLVDIIDTILE